MAVRSQLEADSPRGGRPRDGSREQAILDSAVALLADVGYDAMTIESVAAKAGVGKATIYRRWPGKAELVADAVTTMHAAEHYEPEDTGSLRSDLRAVVSDMIERIEGVDGGLLCGLAVAVRSDAKLGKLMDGHKRSEREKAHALILSRAKERGEIPKTADPPDFLDVAAGLALFRLVNGEALDVAFADYLVERILLPLINV
jgi:AcrR family transcriptional regulator